MYVTIRGSRHAGKRGNLEEKLCIFLQRGANINQGKDRNVSKTDSFVQVDVMLTKSCGSAKRRSWSFREVVKQ